MSIYKHINGFLARASVLPALLVLPAMADTITSQQVIEDTQVVSGVTASNIAGDLGAAYYVYGGNLTLNDSSLVGNSASGSYGDAGAIYNYGTLAVNNSEFDGNSASVYGGAIFNNNFGPLTINQTTFTGNSADYEGGAIENYSGTLTVKDSVFGGTGENDANTAYMGGALGAYDGTIVLDNTTFTGNSANVSGGAINAASADLTIKNGTKFINNEMTSTVAQDEYALGGGAILAENTALNIADATFSGNISAEGGGAIYKYGTGDVSISNSTFTSNVANGNEQVGGAVVIAAGSSGNNSFDNVTFGDGTAAGANHADEAGAIWLGTATTIKNSTFNYNTARNAGAVVIGASAQLTLDNSTFLNNVADTKGGAIATRKKGLAGTSFLHITGDGTDATQFAGNHATNGGAIYTGTNDTAIENTKFAGNIATALGGAIYNEGTLSIDGGTLETNSAKMGGAIYNMGNTTISDATFSGNTTTSTGYGASIFNGMGLLTLTNVTFDGNTADWDGGAISSSTSYIKPSAKPEDFTADTVNEETVRAYWQSKTGFDAKNKMVIIDSTFTNNIVNVYSGGALGVYSDAQITNSHFEHNNAGGNVPADATDGGGAIYAGGWARLDVTGGDFNNNSSNYGGAIATTRAGKENGVYMHIDGATFANNTATVSGGAISNAFADTTLKNVTMTENSATTSGGAIYNTNAITLSGDNTFTGNTAATGADIFNDAGAVVTIGSGTTTIDGGIAGGGDLIVDGTLDFGTTTIEQGTITINGNMVSTIDSADSFGKLIADAFTGDGSINFTNVYDAGTYNVFGGTAAGAADIDVTSDNNIYTVTNNGADGVVFALKDLSEIATENNVSGAAAGTVAALVNSSDDKLAGAAVAAQQALQNGDVAYLESESEKTNPDTKPITHSVATSIQSQVLTLVADRLAPMTMGRAGGDVTAEYGVWAQGLYNKSKFGGKFDGHTTGIAAGVDALINDTYTIGAGYAFNTTKINATDRDTDVDSNTVFVYGQYKPTDWYINATLDYTMSKYNDEMTVFGVNLTGEHDVDTFGAAVMTGYDFASGITPEVGARYLHIMSDAYDTGVGGRVKESTSDFLTAVAGMKYRFDIMSNSSVRWTPELRAAATYDVVSDDMQSTVVIPGNGSYVVDTDRLSRMGGEFGIGLNMAWRGLTVSAVYNLNLHRDYTSQTGLLKFRYAF